MTNTGVRVLSCFESRMFSGNSLFLCGNNRPLRIHVFLLDARPAFSGSAVSCVDGEDVRGGSNGVCG